MTPRGVGAWDAGAQGERIVVLAEPGSLPTDAAKVINAARLVAAPGGLEPVHSRPQARSMNCAALERC